MSQFVDNQWFEVVSCGACGVPFCMSLDFYKKRQDDHKSWWCPNGHQRHYTGDTEVQRLKKELERTAQMRDAAAERANKAESERLQIAKAHRKMRVRVMNGVCPCCTRTFQNLMAHMKTEHPEFRALDSLVALRTAFGMSQTAVAKEAGVHAPHVSLYERGKPVSSYAKARLDSWVESHEAKGETK